MGTHGRYDLNGIPKSSQTLLTVPEENPGNQKHRGVGNAGFLVELSEEEPEEETHEDEEDHSWSVFVMSSVVLTATAICRIYRFNVLAVLAAKGVHNKILF
jgi:hypothetical protein